MICVKRNLPKSEVTVAKKKKNELDVVENGGKKRFNNALLK